MCTLRLRIWWCAITGLRGLQASPGLKGFRWEKQDVNSNWIVPWLDAVQLMI